MPNLHEFVVPGLSGKYTMMRKRDHYINVQDFINRVRKIIQAMKHGFVWRNSLVVGIDIYIWCITSSGYLK